MKTNGTRAELYVHLVWGTFRREPLITAEMEVRLLGCIAAKCVGLRCIAHAVGAMADHVHALIQLDASISVARLVGELKGASSHLLGRRFRWQSGYGAFTVSSDDVGAVRQYVLDQKRHHAHNALLTNLELEVLD